MKNGSGSKGLRYIGRGSFLIGVPARDLSAEEAAQHDRARLLESGLYEEIAAPAKATEPVKAEGDEGNGSR
jgi:hypothetical protein